MVSGMELLIAATLRIALGFRVEVWPRTFRDHFAVELVGAFFLLVVGGAYQAKHKDCCGYCDCFIQVHLRFDWPNTAFDVT